MDAVFFSTDDDVVVMVCADGNRLQVVECQDSDVADDVADALNTLCRAVAM